MTLTSSSQYKWAPGANTTELLKRLRLGRVVVPLDGSGGSERVLPYVLMLSRWFDSEVILTHVISAVKELRQTRQTHTLYPDVDHDRGAELAMAYLGEIARLCKQQNVRVNWGISTGDVGRMVMEKVMINDAGLVILKYPRSNRMRRLVYPSVLDSIWSRTPVPLLLVGESWPKMNIDESLQVPRSFIFAAHSKGSLKMGLPYLKLLTGVTDSKVTIVYPLQKSIFGNRTERAPIERTELDFAVHEIEQSGTEVDVVFVSDDIDAVHALTRVDSHSWTLTSSNFSSTFGHAWQGSMALKLHARQVAPLLIVPTPEVAAKRRAKINRRNG